MHENHRRSVNVHKNSTLIKIEEVKDFMIFFRVHDIILCTVHLLLTHFHASFLHWQWPIFLKNSLSINCIFYCYQIIIRHIYYPLLFSITDLIWSIFQTHNDTWNLRHQNIINYKHQKFLFHLDSKKKNKKSFRYFNFCFVDQRHGN